MPQPNVLFVLADDLGWGDIGCHGSRIETPSIDRLFDRGCELREHYVSPMCTPTRVSLLTGRFPGRFGDRATTPSNEPVLPDGYETIASCLSDGGYETGLFGKWHLGSDPEYGPNEYGFDYAYGSLAGGVDPYSHRYKSGPYSETWHRNGELVDERGHVTDLIVEEATDWIAERSEPWFCYVPFTAVHTPHKPTEHWADKYEDEQFYSDDSLDRGRKRYAAYTSHMDRAVGELVEELKQSGVMENTIVVFTSDNGAIESLKIADTHKYPGWQWETPGVGSNHPFKGEKTELYEGGIRAPTAVLWPGEVESGTLDQPVGVVDWMPTLLELTDSPCDQRERFDGVDIWPQLTGDSDPPDRTLYWNFAGEQFAVRRGKWKLITDSDRERLELYNVGEHPYKEMRGFDRSDDEEVVRELLDELDAQRRSDVESKRSDR